MYYDPRTSVPFIIGFLTLSLIPLYPVIYCNNSECLTRNTIFWESIFALFTGDFFNAKMFLWFCVEYLILIILSAILALSYVKLKYGKILRKGS